MYKDEGPAEVLALNHENSGIIQYNETDIATTEG